MNLITNTESKLSPTKLAIPTLTALTAKEFFALQLGDSLSCELITDELCERVSSIITSSGFNESHLLGAYTVSNNLFMFLSVLFGYALVARFIEKTKSDMNHK